MSNRFNGSITLIVSIAMVAAMAPSTSFASVTDAVDSDTRAMEMGDLRFGAMRSNDSALFDDNTSSINGTYSDMQNEYPELTPEIIATFKDSETEMTDEQRIIAAVEKELFVNELGHFDLYDEQQLILDIGDENYAAVRQGLQELNDLDTNGSVEITANGTVYDTSDDTLSIQGGVNRNYSYLSWWGATRYASYKKAKQLQKAYRNYGLGVTSASAVAGLTGCVPATLITVFYGWRSTAISNEIGDCNKKGVGIKLELGWLAWHRVSRQSYWN